MDSERDNAIASPPLSQPKRRETPQQRERRLARQTQYNNRRKTRATVREHFSSSGSGGYDESNEHYERRLAKQREYTRRRRLAQLVRGVQTNNGMATTVPGDEEESESNGTTTTDDASGCVPIEVIFGAPNADRIAQIKCDLVAALGAEGLDEVVCGVCDRLSLRETSRQVHECDHEYLRSMKRVLKVPSVSLPDGLVAHYACDSIDTRLRGLMLSRRGISKTDTGFNIMICEECLASLKTKCVTPPKFSIANGFYIGELPSHLYEASWIEKVMTQLVTVIAQTRVIRGGEHRSIRSHCMVFDSTPGPPATLLPRRVDREGPYRVVLAGPFSKPQTDRLHKLHSVRGSVVVALLDYFKTHNPFYKNVVIDRSAATECHQGATILSEIAITQESASTNVDEEQDTVHGRSDEATVSTEHEECTFIERNVLLAPVTPTLDIGIASRVIDLNGDLQGAVPQLRVDHSSRFANSSCLEAKMYPHLFPFGRGHPDEARVVRVSKLECVRYYAMLSSRRFAQDATFLLTAFARLSIENMYVNTSVKCRRFSSIFAGYERLTSEDVASALVNNENRQRGRRTVTTVSRDAERFLRSVELGSVSVWGSDAERRQCRQEAFGYQTRFGQPSLFITITPNTDNSYAMAHYTGILGVDTLFDWLEARTPLKSDMKRAAMGDDCASARLFMRTVSAFVRFVLGIDPVTGKRMSTGLFGYTEAYFGMVETQGRGTLHIHFLIWLLGAPENSSAFSSRLETEGEAFKNQLLAFTDSVVTTSLPYDLSKLPCTSCQVPGTLEALPIPSSSRRQSRRCYNSNPVEPCLVHCGTCGSRSSSQHIIRQLLLQQRPHHWPPPMRELTDEEHNNRVQIETRARTSSADANNVVHEREAWLSQAWVSDADKEARRLLEDTDNAQCALSRPEDDPLRNDTVNRLIELTPPSSDEHRMAPSHSAYIVASLVANLNMHWWAHTGSCFKQSRAAGVGTCRYRFPRPLQDRTQFGKDGVELRRTLGHEFINGYNPTIMSTFKCNHDIQVLLGGKETANRIYYCCKYVTKTQRKIDSNTAVALASFQRRQAKEALDDSSNPHFSVQDRQRRRVTSMIYTFTNKQEVAGPLAALYLLRGSCRYSSHVCARIPLSDVLKQVENSEHVCRLVATTEAEEETTPDHRGFRTASFLDDYLYRPSCRNDECLYEFVMQCYRRRRTNTTSEKRLFSQDHPLFASHCLAIRDRMAIPVITGQRLPREKPNMSDDKRDLFARMALVLFKPFRTKLDLLGTDGTTWHQAYTAWEPNRSPFVRTIMCNMDDYHLGREKEDQPVVDECELGAEDRRNYYLSEDDCSESESDGTEFEDGTDMALDFDDTFEGVSEFPTPTAYPDHIVPILDTFRQLGLLRSVALHVASSCASGSDNTQVSYNTDQLRKWVEESRTDCDVGNEGDGEQSEVYAPERLTTVTALVDDLLCPQGLTWPGRTVVATGGDVGLFASIRDVSANYTLNELQHIAFASIARSLLQRWRQTPSETDRTVIAEIEVASNQLLMFMGGEGGTGKSRVIQAVKTFCSSWQRCRAIVLTAMTGKAASIISGRTLASFEMALRGGNAHYTLQDVDCILVDEVSMMSKHNLLRLDRLLRQGKRVAKVPFGGLHVILVGDFLQMPPVGADPLFSDPLDKANPELEDFEGFNLWRLFNQVIVLRESVRFRDDPTWGVGCSKARLGEWTPEFIELINNRVVQHICNDINIRHDTVFVTQDNKTRSAINDHFVQSAADMLPRHTLPIRVLANFKGALNNLSSEDISKIFGLPDTSFKRLAPYLDLIPGMPIQITQNIRTKKCVANGTMGKLISVHFPPGTSFTQVKDKRTGVQVLLPNQRPLHALVHLDRGPNATPIHDGVDPAVFPVFPDSEAFSAATIRLTPSSTGEQRNLRIKIQQFPFVCAVGATVYKVQGESLSAMAVVDWKAGVACVNKPQQAYLMVSRVLRRDALFVLRPFTEDVAEWAKPPESAMHEEQRLRILSENTQQEFIRLVGQ